MRLGISGASSEAVQATNDDAQTSKLSCVQRGYFEDQFLHFFVRRAAKRAPLINRGYYTRHVVLQQLVDRFLSLTATAQLEAQILSLGAGFDTAFFRLQSGGAAPRQYFEVDFQKVTRHKASIISRHVELAQSLGPDAEIQVDEGRISSRQYCLVPGDLRDAAGVQQALRQAGLQPCLPTLVLAECVLVYMEPLDSARLVAGLSAWLPTAACIVYEQIRPDDAFGRQMLLNLEARGCPLRGLHSTPSLEAHRQRFLDSGWGRAFALDLDAIYRQHIDPTDKRRIEQLEIFDEFEEWHLIQEHYCVAVGINDALGIFENFDFERYTGISLQHVPTAR